MATYPLRYGAEIRGTHAAKSVLNHTFCELGFSKKKSASEHSSKKKPDFREEVTLIKGSIKIAP